MTMNVDRYNGIPMQQQQQQQQHQQQQNSKKELHSQIGFYLLPPEQGVDPATASTSAAGPASKNSKRRSTKKTLSSKTNTSQVNPK